MTDPIPTKIIYDIANPSDPYTMESDDPVAAAIACMLLGNGAYALTTKDGTQVCPLFLFGGDPDKWLLETHGTTIDASMTERGEAIAVAFESVMIGGIFERESANSAMARMTPENAKAWREEQHDWRRTSMNDIGSRARKYAASMRESLQKVEAANG